MNEPLEDFNLNREMRPEPCIFLTNEKFTASRIKTLEKVGFHVDEKVTVSAHKYNIIWQHLYQYDALTLLNWRDASS